MKDENDRLTAAAIAIIAMCLVTCDHEAFGHGGACLLLHGHITVLTTSIFHCDLRSGWIDPAGPLGNLVGGTVALIGQGFVPRRWVGVRLFLLSVTAFSYFWEGAYLPYAMYKQNGDLYFFAQFLMGDVSLAARSVLALSGVILFVGTARLTARALLDLWPEPAVARRMARTVWIGATTGSAIAALAFQGHGWADFHDSILEIGVASVPLLFIPRGPTKRDTRSSAALPRSYATIVLAMLVLLTFTLTLGRGIG